jgi:hypothetical protein
MAVPVRWLEGTQLRQGNKGRESKKESGGVLM